MATIAAEPGPDAADVARGVCRLFARAGLACLIEVPLGNGRRADVLALDPQGRLTIVEIKVSLADLRGDAKWPDYLDYCDRFFWAVPELLCRHLDLPAFAPERTGLIVADRYDAAELRPAAWTPLNAARRKAETLRFARRAAARWHMSIDPDADAEQGIV
jgi:hypothetical protein